MIHMKNEKILRHYQNQIMLSEKILLYQSVISMEIMVHSYETYLQQKSLIIHTTGKDEIQKLYYTEIYLQIDIRTV
jgi:hypothetical protein